MFVTVMYNFPEHNLFYIILNSVQYTKRNGYHMLHGNDCVLDLPVLRQSVVCSCLSGLSLFSYMLSIVWTAASIDGHLPFLAACTYYVIVILLFTYKLCSVLFCVVKMIIPVRCFTCGKVIGNKWEAYLSLLQADYTEGYLKLCFTRCITALDICREVEI